MDRLVSDRMFVAVMESGSFTAAAERLGTTSGQASKLVSRLESELGVRLLNRTTRSVSPTEAGQAYFDRLRPLLDEYDNLEAEVRDATHAPRGHLRLTAPLSFGVVELTPALNAFALRFPKIQLDVSYSGRIVNLVDEGFDIAEVERPTPVRGRVRYANAEACLRAAEAGLGLACVPAFVAGAAIRSGYVTCVLADYEPEPYGVHALYPHSRHLAAKVRALVDFLAERYRGTPRWEDGW